MGSTDVQPKVDNPRLAALKALRANLLTQTAELRRLLETTSRDLGSGKVWVGKAADAWHSELEGRRTHMKTLIDEVIPALDAEIAKCPDKVPPGMAKMMRMDLEGH
ncbi:hypothetical protein [Streptomyces sp. NPDC006739]|uniref:hypothetical protein n=1 Tax=Streptomyces sp. NPDC006739 TaxID=3364763 RepID=UPI0036C8BBEE